MALPLARPAIVVGLTLALLEALNDIGASEFLGVRTLTVAIYSTWVTRSDLPGAAQIALAMLAMVLLLVALERRARERRQYANDAQHPRPLEPHRLSGWKSAAALATCLIPIGIGFVIPAAYLIDESLRRIRFAGISTAIVSETDQHDRDLASGNGADGRQPAWWWRTRCGSTAARCRPRYPVLRRSATPCQAPCWRSACCRS